MYPRLSSNQAKKVRDEIRTAQNENLPFGDLVDQNLKNLIQYVEQGESLTETTIEDLYLQAKAIQHDIAFGDLITKRRKGAIKEATAKGEYLEELMTEHLHKALDSVDPRALHDAGFWRFLALFPYRWYLLEREPEMYDNDFGGGEGSKRYWLLLRTFIIGRKSKSSGMPDEYVNTRAYRDARRRQGLSDGYWVDFYHSHIARKKWHDCVNVSNAYISSCVTSPEALDIDNESKRYAGSLAKRLLRISPNILLEALPSAELRDLIDREKNKVLGL
jgi:hypothetical protein